MLMHTKFVVTIGQPYQLSYKHIYIFIIPNNLVYMCVGQILVLEDINISFFLSQVA